MRNYNGDAWFLDTNQYKKHFCLNRITKYTSNKIYLIVKIYNANKSTSDTNTILTKFVFEYFISAKIQEK